MLNQKNYLQRNHFRLYFYIISHPHLHSYPNYTHILHIVLNLPPDGNNNYNNPNCAISIIFRAAWTVWVSAGWTCWTASVMLNVGDSLWPPPEPKPPPPLPRRWPDGLLCPWTGLNDADISGRWSFSIDLTIYLIYVINEITISNLNPYGNL